MTDKPVIDSKNDGFGKPMIWLSYCPDLGIYHVHAESSDTEEPSDSKYDREEMVSAVEALQRAGEAQQAELMARLAADARLYPHKVIVFFDTGRSRICNPWPPHEEEIEERREHCEAQVKWQAEHPDGAGLVVAPTYPSLAKQG